MNRCFWFYKQHSNLSENYVERGPSWRFKENCIKQEGAVVRPTRYEVVMAAFTVRAHY